MKVLEHKKGIVFNIQHFSIHDGPGIRTVVFLKGCPLRCRWCANPESQKASLELGWTRGECIHCGGCIKQLKDLECTFDEDGILSWNPKRSCDPDSVSRICPSKALHVIGEERNAEAVFEEVKQDQVFYKNSGGGLTVSGGEPLLQPEFLSELLHLAGAAGIHRAIETTLYTDWDNAARILPELDLLIVDLKSMNDALHREWIGVSNQKIIQNIELARQKFPDLPMLVRTPVIPGFNDQIREIASIVEFLNELREAGHASIQYEPLKYHKLGEPKYASLNRSYEMGDAELTEEIFSEIKSYVDQHLEKGSPASEYRKKES